MLGYIEGIIVIIIEMLLYQTYMENFINRKNHHFRNNKGLILLILCVLSYGTAVFLYHYTLIKSITLVIAMTLVISTFYFIEIRKCIVLTIFFQGLLFSVDYFVLSIFYSVLPSESIDSPIEQTLMMALSKLVLFLIVAFIRNHIMRQSTFTLNDVDWLKFMFVPIISIGTIIYLLSNLTAIIKTGFMDFFSALSLGLLGLNLYVFNMIQDIAEREYRLRENKILEVKANNQLLLYKKISDNFDTQNKKMHEYKNQLECLSVLSKKKNYKELDQYLEQISDSVTHDTGYVDTHNVIINAIINQKYREMIDNHIVVVLQLSDMSELWIEEKDIVIILANLLDNAIEACKKLNGKRIVKIKMVIQHKMLLIAVRNTYDGVYWYVDNSFLTTKTSNVEEHGLGIINVVQTIKKYNGSYDISKDGEFSFVIMIPHPNSN